MLYQEGIGGHPQDHEKALELYNRSGELGYAKAYVYIGCDIAVVAITVASIILTWFILILRDSNNKSKEHDKKLFK